MGFDEIMMNELKHQERLHKSAERILKNPVPGVLLSKTRPDGRMQFYIPDPLTRRQRYVNLNHLDDIRFLLDQKYARTLLEITERNIQGLNYAKEYYRSVEPDRIFRTLPKAYREARDYLRRHGHDETVTGLTGRGQGFSPSEKIGMEQGLIHKTSFGLAVRSKGEVLIAEALFAAGFWVYYEKRLELWGERGEVIVVFPDFTIDLGNGTVIYWEHKGMMGDYQYAEKDMRKTRLYFMNGIYQPVNLIVTCDGPDGGTDMEAIGRIINGVILPQASKSALS